MFFPFDALFFSCFPGNTILHAPWSIWFVFVDLRCSPSNGPRWESKDPTLKKKKKKNSKSHHQHSIHKDNTMIYIYIYIYILRHTKFSTLYWDASYVLISLVFRGKFIKEMEFKSRCIICDTHFFQYWKLDYVMDRKEINHLNIWLRHLGFVIHVIRSFFYFFYY